MWFVIGLRNTLTFPFIESGNPNAQGGAFGERGEMSPLDYCAAALAIKTGRPMKMTFSREEEFENTRPRIKEIISCQNRGK